MPLAKTGRVVEAEAGVKAFARLAPDLFAGDAKALGEFRTAFFDKGTFHPEAFQNRKNFFGGRNVTVIVLEVPMALIRKGASARLGDRVAARPRAGGPGLPLGTSTDHKHLHARSSNARGLQPRCSSRRRLAVLRADRGRCSQVDAELAGSATDPTGYGKMLAQKLCPVTLPDELDTEACFTVDRLNGRGLADDVMDVILTLATHTPLSDGVAPQKPHAGRVSLFRRALRYPASPWARVNPSVVFGLKRLAGSS